MTQPAIAESALQQKPNFSAGKKKKGREETEGEIKIFPTEI